MQTYRLTCTRCQKSISFAPRGRCICGGTLLVRYDPELAGRLLTKELLKSRPASMWRYKEWLPVSDPGSIVSLGEGWTPLLPLETLAGALGIRNLWVKREEQNPTGSFKARGFSSAISILKEHGVAKVAVPSNGNAASAMAAYAARAGMQAVVIVPADCPGIIMEECRRYGAELYVVDGLIHDAGRIIDEGAEEMGWFNVGTLKEPGRVEGKKTMGFEVAEQLAWTLPDVIVYPTGGGSGIVGMWKAFHELREMGFIDGPLPRMVSVQEAGCQPIADALSLPQEQGGKPIQAAEPVTSAPTGLRVPNPPDGRLLVDILRETDGTAIAVSSEEIAAAQRLAGRHGISSSPEGAAALAGCIRLRESGWITGEERVVVFNTSHADKYLPWQPAQMPPVIRSYSELKAYRTDLEKERSSGLS